MGRRLIRHDFAGPGAIAQPDEGHHQRAGPADADETKFANFNGVLAFIIRMSRPSAARHLPCGRAEHCLGDIKAGAEFLHYYHHYYLAEWLLTPPHYAHWYFMMSGHTNGLMPASGR